MADATHPAMDRFVAAVDDIVERGGTEQEITTAVASHLRELVAEGPQILPDGLRQAREDGYAMYPVHVAPDGRFSVAAAIWGVGQVTPIHDHGTWGVIGILDGVEHERRFGFPPEDGGAPPYLDERDLVPGDVDTCCTSDQDIHQVACASEVPTVALHVYGADIGTLQRRAYDHETGAMKTFVSQWVTPAATA